MGVFDKVGEFLGGAAEKVVETVKEGPAELINMVLGGIGSLVKEGIKALGPLIAGMIESLVSVLFEYIVYAIKKLIVPICKYGGFILGCMGFLLFVFFGIVCLCWMDKDTEEALKGPQYDVVFVTDAKGNIRKNDKGENMTKKVCTHYIPLPGYTEYKELKFKYGVAWGASLFVFVLGGGLCAMGWFLFKPPQSPPDITKCFQPFENAIK